MKSFNRNTMVILSALIMSGCSLLSPVANKTPSKFMVDKVPANIPVKRPHAATILVAIPETRSIYNTTQIAYTRKPYQIEYLSQNEWAETPVQMLQPALVQTLQNTHYFHAVITPPSLDHYEYTLNTQIVAYQEDFTYRMPLFIMTVRAQLSRTSVNQVVATKEFTVEEPIPQGTPYGAVLAANHANEKILAEIARFCLEKLR